MSDDVMVVERAAFELWATESYGGDMGDKLDRDSHFPEDYKYADVHMAWKAWLYRAENVRRICTHRVKGASDPQKEK